MCTQHHTVCPEPPSDRYHIEHLNDHYLRELTENRYLLPFSFQIRGNFRRDDGCYALHLAVYANRAEVCSWLLEVGTTDMLSAIGQEKTAPGHAIAQGSAEAEAVLRAVGATE